MTQHSTASEVLPDDGEIPDLPATRECPYHPPSGFAALREQGPVTRVKLFDGRVVWAVTGFAEAREALAHPAMSSSRTHPNFPVPIPAFAKVLKTARADGKAPMLARTLNSIDPPEHTRQRRMLIATFTVRRITALREKIQRAVDELIDRMVGQGPPVDLVSSFALPISSQTISELLGVPYADHEFFEAQSRRRLDPAQTMAALAELSRYFEELIDAKLAEPGDGLMDALIASQTEQGTLNRAELAGLALGMLLAGHDTTTTSIALGAIALADHPDQWGALRDDPSLAGNAVEELLRFVSTVSGLPRVATEDMRIGGRLIRAGDGVLVAGVAANRDPSALERPDELDLRRADRPHITFGYGIHQCLGQNLARAELEIAFRTLATRLPDLRLAVPSNEVPIAQQGNMLRVLELPVTW